MEGPSPINLSLISDKTLDVIAQALDLDLRQVQPEEFRLGIVQELDHMMVYTSAGLNNEKLTKAAMTAWENLQELPTFYSSPPAQEFGHVLTGTQFQSGDARIENLNRLVDDMINEDFASTVAALKAAPANLWNKAKAQLTKSTGLFKGLMSKSLGKFEAGMAKIKPLVGLIQQAESETGAKLPTNEMMQIAQSLPAEAKAAQAEIEQQKAAVKSLPPAEPAQAQVECAIHFNNILTEVIEAKPEQKRIDEALTPMVIVGFILALIGGIPMLINGLHKLATKMKLEKTAAFLAKVHHVAHNFEHKAVDFLIPDILSYAIYTKFWKAGIKVRGSRAMEKPLSREEYSSDVDHVRGTVEGIIYKILLIWFLMQGVRGAYHAGTSLLGLAEGAASSVKAVEIAAVVTQVAEILGPDALEAAGSSES